MELTSEKGLNTGQIEELTKHLRDIADENIGMPMVFSLAEAAKEWMEERNEKSKGDGSAFERMQQRKRALEREEEKKRKAIEKKEQRNRQADEEEVKKSRQLLNAMTETEFYSWRSKFEEETKDPDTVRESAIKMTGRKIFDMGLAKGGAAAVRRAEESLRSKSASIDEDAAAAKDEAVDVDLFTEEGGLDDLIGDMDDLLDGF